MSDIKKRFGKRNFLIFSKTKRLQAKVLELSKFQNRLIKFSMNILSRSWHKLLIQLRFAFKSTGRNDRMIFFTELITFNLIFSLLLNVSFVFRVTNRLTCISFKPWEQYCFHCWWGGKHDGAKKRSGNQPPLTVHPVSLACESFEYEIQFCSYSACQPGFGFIAVKRVRGNFDRSNEKC